MTTQLLNSVISRPAADSRIEVGKSSIHGFAWSPDAAIREVAVDIDGSQRLIAVLEQPMGRGWTPWRAEWIATPGTHTIACRAVDETGSEQPHADDVPPNDLGYGFNGVVAITVTAEATATPLRP